MFTNDIYAFIGGSLISDGYVDVKDISVSVLEEKIKEFLRRKLFERDTNVDITTLLRKIEGLIDENVRDKMMANFTFCLLNYMSALQGFGITWRIEEVDTPYFQESTFAPGKIDSLVTRKDIDFVDTFNFVLEEARKLNNEESRGK